MISANPTRTKTIEKNWIKANKRRFRALQRWVKDNLQLRVNLARDDVAGFTDQFDQQTEIIISDGNYQALFQDQAYERGLENFYSQLDIEEDESIAEELMLLLLITDKKDLAKVISTKPEHLETKRFLEDRAKERFKGWSNQMKADVKQIIQNSITQGLTLEETTAQIVERIKVTEVKARRIAATETNQAYAQAQIKEAQRLSAATGTPVGLRWITMMDSRVRDLHAGWHGSVNSPEKTDQMKQVSPWNCRCGVRPVIKNTKEEQKRYDFEKSALLAMEKKK